MDVKLQNKIVEDIIRTLQFQEYSSIIKAKQVNKRKISPKKLRMLRGLIMIVSKLNYCWITYYFVQFHAFIKNFKSFIYFSDIFLKNGIFILPGIHYFYWIEQNN